MMCPSEHSITISVPPAEFELEAKYFQPASDESPAVCIIVCHPHPTMGGDMDNNVVVAIFNEFVARQWPVLRFNFRGVGHSGGTFDNGVGEVDDVKAAMQFFCEYATAPQVFVVGYSFGAAMGGAAAAESPAALGYAAVAIPFNLFPLHAQRMNCAKFKYFVAGARDPFTPLQDFEREVKKFSKAKESTIITGADHFFMGNEQKVAKAVADYFEQQEQSGRLYSPP